MRTGNTMIAAILAISFWGVMTPGQSHPSAFWRMLVASVSACLVTAAVDVLLRRIKASRAR